MREMHTLTTPRRVEEIQLSNGGLTRALTAPARDPRPGFCVGRADDVNSVAATGCPWHPLRRAPRPRARHWRPWYLRGRFGTAKTERDATLATIDTVSRVYRIGHQISIRLRPTRGAATRDPSAQPRYHGISPRSLDLPVACARPSDRNSIDSARLRCPRALFVRSPPTIRTLPGLDPSASKSNIESGGPGSRDFRDRFLGLRGNFAARHAKSTPEIFNSVSRGRYISTQRRFRALFSFGFEIWRMADGPRLSPRAKGKTGRGGGHRGRVRSLCHPSRARPTRRHRIYARARPPRVACRSPPWFPG